MGSGRPFSWTGPWGASRGGVAALRVGAQQSCVLYTSTCSRDRWLARHLTFDNERCTVFTTSGDARENGTRPRSRHPTPSIESRAESAAISLGPPRASAYPANDLRPARRRDEMDRGEEEA